MGIGAAAAIGAAGSIGGALISKKGSGGSSNSVTQNMPWMYSQPYDITGLQAAQQVYGQRQAIGPYQGEFTAGGNPVQQNAINTAANYNQSYGGAVPNMTAQTAGNLQAAAAPFVNNAESLYNTGIAGPNAGLYGTLENYGTGAARTGGPNGALSSALGSAAVNGANALNGFTNNLGTIGQTALSDPTSRIANDAASYANNPGVQAMLKSTNAGIDQTLNEQTLPTLNRNASMAGNLNSSRAGAEEGMAREGSALAKGNADASILNNAYNTGTNTAANLYASGLNTATNANTSGLFDVGMNTNNEANREQSLNEFNTTNQLNAANSGLSQGLGYELGDINSRLAANGQLGSAAGEGITGANAAGNEALTNFNLGAGAGGLQQSLQQAQDTNALNQWQMDQSYPQQILNDWWKISSTPLGSTSTNNTTIQAPTPNPVNMGVGGALAGAGLYQMFGGGGGGSGPGYGSSNSTDPYNGLYGISPGVLQSIQQASGGPAYTGMPGLY